MGKPVVSRNNSHSNQQLKAAGRMTGQLGLLVINCSNLIKAAKVWPGGLWSRNIHIHLSPFFQTDLFIFIREWFYCVFLGECCQAKVWFDLSSYCQSERDSSPCLPSCSLHNVRTAIKRWGEGELAWNWAQIKQGEANLHCYISHVFLPLCWDEVQK